MPYIISVLVSKTAVKKDYRLGDVELKERIVVTAWRLEIKMLAGP